jgi:protocatechuate 3,4-dioxygenase beta subunit
VRHEPTYEGRPLVRPDEEVVDQGLGFDVTTLLSRRRVLRALGLGAAAASLAACGSGTTGTPAASGTGLVEIPDETAGPYPGDGSNGPDVLAESGIVRSDIRSSFGGASGTADGVPLTIRLTVLDIADSSGRVSFTSIFPACYSGRWPHIHFEVYPDQAGITDASNAIATSQIALPHDACEVVYAQPGYEQSVRNLSQVTLATDNVFGDDGGARELGAVTGDVTIGYTVSLTAAVDTTTAPTAGSAPGGPPPSR